jgi:hypothetical protein
VSKSAPPAAQARFSMISSRAFADGQVDRRVGLSQAVDETAAPLRTTEFDRQDHP